MTFAAPPPSAPGPTGTEAAAPGSATVPTGIRTATVTRPRPRPPAGQPKPGKAPARRGRLGALDGLRLIAALMVACYHYGGRGGDISRAWDASPAQLFPALHSLFAYGCLGVQIFFVISGFVICMSGWGRTARSFLASRVSRLMPAYWVAILLVTLVFALPSVAWDATSPSDTLLNLTLLQEPLGAPRVLGVDWTLWVEIRFYALFAVCLVLPGVTRRRVVLFCVAWTLAAAIGQASGGTTAELVLMPEYAPYFIGGMGLYLLHRNRHDAMAWGIVVVSWLTGQHYAVADLWHTDSPKFFSYRSGWAIMLVVTAGFVLVGAIALGYLGWANRLRLTTLGALTYPFYLVHEHLGWVSVGTLHRSLGLPPGATLAASLAGMLLLAWLLNRYVERWATPLLRDRLLTVRA
ncbi:acyltransferase family protein [Streptomyces sp. NPDC050560]|uniref:acyltransferase family protein n=1 Tax=Streptomyces sp. NPDC050560 TaxID=3365630 RepID=UPI0037886E86